jgi:hypothetical protein
MFGRWVLLCATALGVVACGADDGNSDNDGQPGPAESNVSENSASADDPATIAKKLEEKPWEVVSNKGETYLPNVFYADASENEQIMPYAIDGHVMIDRLIYPTLGNPNLYTKDDINDELAVVLRIEDAAMAHLNPRLEDVAGSNLKRLVVPNDPATGFAFFLVPRSARGTATESKSAISFGAGTDVVRVYPNSVFVNPEPDDEPAQFKKRHTVRFLFKQGAMQRAGAGLYDLRFEMKNDNAIVNVDNKPVVEWQFNAVRVFDHEPDEHSVVNITDTQVSVGDIYGSKTRDKLDELVQFINTTNDSAIRNASFITFNGDLHNGGSPGSLRQRPVATTYAEESKSIVNLLKYLPMPIFLTTGNHDGYTSIGQVPAAVKTVDSVILDNLDKVIDDQTSRPWAGFNHADFNAYLARTAGEDRLGGDHMDIFTGGFARSPKKDGFAGWKQIPKADRNFILYDGFYQWQKTYGPLYYSHKFGKNFYVSLNSYELRQHRRSGWGMYTVNYGGGMSDVQMAWLDRELLRGKQDGSDVIVLAHHDPRGGHKGKDLGYYYEQMDYRSIYQSAIDYLVGHTWNPAVCQLPDWALSEGQTDSCAHDGLQEWMRPDTEFDCDWDQRNPDFTCDTSKGDPFASGIELLKRLASSPQVRTLLLGHTHYNAMEVIQQGEELVPGQFPVDGDAAVKFATLEVVNPLRGYSSSQQTADYDPHRVPISPIEQSFNQFTKQYDKSVTGWNRTLTAASTPRELLVLRLVSAADLANETYSGGKSAMGFSVLSLTKKDDPRAVTQPQINHAKFFANTGQATFTVVGEIDIDRTKSLKPHDAQNPVQKLYTW